MTIEEILKKHSIDEICKSTKIKKENLQKIFDKDLSSFNRTRLHGFISILERDYGPIFELREEFDNQFPPTSSIEDMESYSYEPKRDRDFKKSDNSSKLIWVIGGLALLIFLATMAFKADDKSVNTSQTMDIDLNDTSLIDQNNTTVESNASTDENTTGLGNQTEDSNTTPNVHRSDTLGSTSPLAYRIVPTKKLWFGVFDLNSKKAQDHLIAEPFEINSSNFVLIATSQAPFTIDDSSATSKDYKDYKRHYFKVENGLLSEITKDEFVVLGGPKKW